MKNLCSYLAGLFLATALAVAVPLALMYVMFGCTDECARLGQVELCLIAASFVTFIGGCNA